MNRLWIVLAALAALLLIAATPVSAQTNNDARLTVAIEVGCGPNTIDVCGKKKPAPSVVATIVSNAPSSSNAGLVAIGVTFSPALATGVLTSPSLVDDVGMFVPTPYKVLRSTPLRDGRQFIDRMDC